MSELTRCTAALIRAKDEEIARLKARLENADSVVGAAFVALESVHVSTTTELCQKLKDLVSEASVRAMTFLKGEEG